MTANTLYSLAPKSFRSTVNNTPVLSSIKQKLDLNTYSSLAEKLGYSISEPSQTIFEPRPDSFKTQSPKKVNFRSNPSFFL